MILIDKTGLIIPTIISAAIHEAGHLFALWAYDCPPVSVDLIPAGVRITKRNDHTFTGTAVCALSGPLLNLAVAFCSALNYFMYKREYVLLFFAINAFLGLFNLIPVYGLDGGTVLLCLLEKRFPLKTAMNITRAISFLFAAALCFMGVYFLRRGYLNASIFIAALYIAFCALSMTRE